MLSPLLPEWRRHQVSGHGENQEGQRVQAAASQASRNLRHLCFLGSGRTGVFGLVGPVDWFGGMQHAGRYRRHNPSVPRSVHARARRLARLHRDQSAQKLPLTNASNSGHQYVQIEQSPDGPVRLQGPSSITAQDGQLPPNAIAFLGAAVIATASARRASESRKNFLRIDASDMVKSD